MKKTVSDFEEARRIVDKISIPDAMRWYLFERPEAQESIRNWLANTPFVPFEHPDPDYTPFLNVNNPYFHLNAEPDMAELEFLDGVELFQLEDRFALYSEGYLADVWYIDRIDSSESAEDPVYHMVSDNTGRTTKWPHRLLEEAVAGGLLHQWRRPQ